MLGSNPGKTRYECLCLEDLLENVFPSINVENIECHALISYSKIYT